MHQPMRESMKVLHRDVGAEFEQAGSGENKMNNDGIMRSRKR